MKQSPMWLNAVELTPKNVGNITLSLINIERAYANSVVNNDMDRIIDIFGRRNGRDSYFF